MPSGTYANNYDPSEDNPYAPQNAGPTSNGDSGYVPQAAPTNPNGMLASNWGAGQAPGAFQGFGANEGKQDMGAYDTAGQAFQSRAPITANMGASNASYGQAGQNFAASQASRGGQLGALGLLAGQANGTAVDPAVQQMNAQAQAAGQAQQSIAAGAGGGFGGAAAAAGANRQAANLQQQNVQQAQIQHAQDMAQARAAYSSASNDLRSTDQAQRSASMGQAYQQGQLGNMQAQLGLANQQANDAQTQAYGTLGAQYAQLGENGAMTQFGGATGLAANNAALNGQAFGQLSQAVGAGVPTAAQGFGGGGGAQGAQPQEEEPQGSGYGPSYGV
jgi:hypothetical protein